MLRVFGRFSALRRNLAATLNRRHDELRHTWYAVLGVKESATHAEIEEAFYDKLTKTEINLNSQSEKEVDDILDQNMIIMDAYKTLSHPSRRIDYDVKLKMYRRGDFKKKTDEVKRQRDGAFLKLEKQQDPEEENIETLLDKAKGLEKEFYAEAKEQPRFLGTAKFEENFEHNVEHSLRESQALRRNALKETLSNIESEKLKVPSVLGAGAEVDANVRRYANIGLGAVAFIILGMWMWGRKKRQNQRTIESDAFQEAYNKELQALSSLAVSEKTSDSK
ncbi:Oidioi.mRNA.OKI2018_I69.chr1.g1813.t1.cds [Oikopleura dioica]|uniref:Oidioi.mRNA.OKI2018_I69.chr1.g1813.t1.cds n=1 Tax=Oikopleura dioica TaxID=34765 RepID=A0ABN7SUD5_OIKDI|nr:Oidioi.mRNA.OKI2018_I69.chr1.g1813.t1.cds [Oikopleura dioica]